MKKDNEKNIVIGYRKSGTPITLKQVRKRLDKEEKEKEKHVKKVIERLKKAPERLVGVIGKSLEIHPKKFLFKRNRATIILPVKKAKPILRRSEIFENEYEKEKSLLGWK